MTDCCKSRWRWTTAPVRCSRTAVSACGASRPRRRHLAAPASRARAKPLSTRARQQRQCLQRRWRCRRRVRWPRCERAGSTRLITAPHSTPAARSCRSPWRRWSQTRAWRRRRARRKLACPRRCRTTRPLIDLSWKYFRPHPRPTRHYPRTPKAETQEAEAEDKTSELQ